MSLIDWLVVLGVLGGGMVQVVTAPHSEIAWRLWIVATLGILVINSRAILP